MRTLPLLCLTCLPLSALTAELGEPIISFAPMTASDGTKTWRFVGPWRLNADDAALNNALSFKIGEAHWCPNGWQITSRRKAAGFLMIEGRCL
jgi:hypothetical protein